MTPTTPLGLDLARVGWTPPELARRLGKPARTVQQWATGKHPPPAGVAAYVARVARLVERVPVPG